MFSLGVFSGFGCCGGYIEFNCYNTLQTQNLGTEWNLCFEQETIRDGDGVQNALHEMMASVRYNLCFPNVL